MWGSKQWFCMVLVACGWRNLVEARGGKNLPARFPKCRRNDPVYLDECWKKASETVRPFIQEGVPELGIPIMDPFVIPQIVLEQGTAALNFKALLNNVSVSGLTDYHFSGFHFDVPDLQFFCNATIGAMELEGDYTVNGKILLAPIVGKGKFNASVGSTNVTVYQKVEKVTRKGETYLSPVHTNTSIQVGHPVAHLSGLFDGNEELNQVTNKVIMDNIDDLFEEIRPVLETVITNIMEDLLLKGFEDNVPFDVLYPPN